MNVDAYRSHINTEAAPTVRSRRTRNREAACIDYEHFDQFARMACNDVKRLGAIMDYAHIVVTVRLSGSNREQGLKIMMDKLRNTLHVAGEDFGASVVAVNVEKQL